MKKNTSVEKNNRCIKCGGLYFGEIEYTGDFYCNCIIEHNNVKIRKSERDLPYGIKFFTFTDVIDFALHYHTPKSKKKQKYIRRNLEILLNKWHESRYLNSNHICEKCLSRNTTDNLQTITCWNCGFVWPKE